MSDMKPFVLDFDLANGFYTGGRVKPTQRKVSDVVVQFASEAAARAMVEGGDPLLYEFYGLDLPEDSSGMLQFGTTVLYPGKVGEEYLTTKGHLHTILDTSEIYCGLSDRGMMLIETPEGQVDWKGIGPGEVLYIPGRWAHHSINTGTEPLMTFPVYRGDAGHGYGTIEEKGYRKLVVERDERPAVIGNPKWKA